MCFRAGSLSPLLGVWVYDRVILITFAYYRHRSRNFVKIAPFIMLIVEVMSSLQSFFCIDIAGLDHLGGIYVAMRHGGTLFTTYLDTDQGLTDSGSRYALTFSLASRC